MRVTTGMWTNNIILFLFDHQLVYCKKDILKRNTYVYKGRIYLDTSEVIDVPDGKGNRVLTTFVLKRWVICKKLLLIHIFHLDNR